MVLRMGTPAALFIWVVIPTSHAQLLADCDKSFVCLTAFFVSQTALQACSRTVYAFSRDHGEQHSLINTSSSD